MSITKSFDTIKSLRNFLKFRGIKYKESNGYFKITIENKEDEELTKRFFKIRQIEYTEKVSV